VPDAAPAHRQLPSAPPGSGGAGARRAWLRRGEGGAVILHRRLPPSLRGPSAHTRTLGCGEGSGSAAPLVSFDSAYVSRRRPSSVSRSLSHGTCAARGPTRSRHAEQRGERGGVISDRHPREASSEHRTQIPIISSIGSICLQLPLTGVIVGYHPKPGWQRLTSGAAFGRPGRGACKRRRTAPGRAGCSCSLNAL
jgi:hypothetical protein